MPASAFPHPRLLAGRPHRLATITAADHLARQPASRYDYTPLIRTGPVHRLAARPPRPCSDEQRDGVAACSGAEHLDEAGKQRAALQAAGLRDREQPFDRVTVSDSARLRDVTGEQDIVAAVLALPAVRAQKIARDLADAGLKIIFNYSEALLDLPEDVRVLTSSPATELVVALSLGPG